MQQRGYLSFCIQHFQEFGQGRLLAAYSSPSPNPLALCPHPTDPLASPPGFSSSFDCLMLVFPLGRLSLFKLQITSKGQLHKKYSLIAS